MRIRHWAIAALSIVMLVGCGEGVETGDELEAAGGGKADLAAPADLAEGEVCDPEGPDRCVEGTRCVEYTVHDWPRCLTPLPDGEYCSSHDRCASNRCDLQTARCAPALQVNDVCDPVYDAGLCPAGTACVEYTVYDWPRCR